MLAEWEQCGGSMASSTSVAYGWAAADKPYNGACCPAGWQCFRKVGHAAAAAACASSLPLPLVPSPGVRGSDRRRWH